MTVVVAASASGYEIILKLRQRLKFHGDAADFYLVQSLLSWYSIVTMDTRRHPRVLVELNEWVELIRF